MSKTVELGQRRNIVVAENLRMVYRVGKVEVSALRGVDMTVREGEFVAVMGPSGCGKSTLLHLLGGLLTPTSGHVWIDGVDLTRVSDARRTEIRRHKIGFVFQRYNLLPTLSAAENIELARRIHGNGQRNGTRSNVEDILAMFGLEHKLHHKPSELSGGEQQRVAIARAIINRPAILLADEPTGNLDSVNSQMVLEMLQNLNQTHRQTIVMITHDPEAAAVASRILEMRDGKILNRVRNLYYTAESTGVQA
ncbi:MAG TPA: ABC transporter ATP-binding protein [Acidobacteriota bacterium]|jgi:putative ABC transport system ATP-binding protein|nr:ABC transporter ATP-binding protein [Acidobacteriota bacterium]HRV07974.1 ABC transporter ATP-binding protein [Acidobacteriota bacterium]